MEESKKREKVEFVPLNGRVVSADLGLLGFLLPGWVIRKEVNMLDAEYNVIYTGNYSSQMLQKLRLYSKNFVMTNGPMALDLNSHEGLLAYVYSKHKKPVPKAALANMNNYSEEEFLNIVKRIWMIGSFPFPDDSDENNLFTLFSVFTKSPLDFFNVYVSLVNRHKPEYIEFSLFTFFDRVMDFENQNVSTQYNSVLFDAKRVFGHKLLPTLIELHSINDLPSRLRMISLYLNLNEKQ